MARLLLGEGCEARELDQDLSLVAFLKSCGGNQDR
jgi:hypothetical protein